MLVEFQLCSKFATTSAPMVSGLPLRSKLPSPSARTMPWNLVLPP
jgi:hypothetical protein